MKKKLKCLLCSAMAVILFAACGSNAPEATRMDKLTDAQMEADKEKTELVLATMRSPADTLKMENEIQDAASAFNQSNEHYHVTVVDYLQEGNEGKKNGLQKLNTEITSGTYPDMICFSQISLSPFLTKGLLLDMDTCISKDETITSEDLVAVKALRSLGGLHLLGSNITADTLIAQYARFGDRYGWSFQEYLDIENAEGSDVWVIYNITHELLLKEVAKRYVRTAIDWETGECSFNNEDFIELLNACARIQEKPETAGNELIGLGASFVAEGKLITAVVMTDQVNTLALNEALAGEKLSYIGWPTVDGSCGTDVRFQHPVGIVSKGKHIEGCWEFIKYLLKERRVNYGIPVYMPRLKELMKEAESSDEKYTQMTNEQAERFLDLLDHIENVAIYDETVMDIIMSESEDFFAGHRTAEETADIIQSKVRLYLAELK